jgi:hypothetical protein
MSTVLRLLCITLILIAGSSIRAKGQVWLSPEAFEQWEDDLRDDPEREYLFRMVNGDIITGTIVDLEQWSAAERPSATAGSLDEHDTETLGFTVIVDALAGKLKLDSRDIAYVDQRHETYRHRHRGYIIPTAQPIGDDAFIGLWEIGFLYAGGGIGPLSITAGRSFVPGIPARDQFSLVNMKVTVAEADNGLVESGKQFYAVGFNGAWLNDKNFIGHAYANATFTGSRSQATTTFFTKVAGQELLQVNLGTLVNAFNLPLANGAFGVAISIDTRFPEFHDLHAVMELANADITRPSNTLLYLGVRTALSAVGMDFGITLAPGPTVIPAVAFAWTPF